MHKPTKQRFVILAAPRSGSNMLCTMLNSHADILCHHEIYNPRGIFYALQLRDTDFHLGDIVERDAHPKHFLNKLWLTTEDHSHIGFKMTHRQNPTVFETLLEDTNVKKIILRRKNKIKTHVSRLIAEQRDVWEDYRHTNDTDLTPVRVNVNINALYQDIECNERYYQEVFTALTDSEQTYCTLEYEALEFIEHQRKALDFLGLNHQPLIIKSRKQNPDDLRLTIKNYNQLSTQLADARLAKELRA